MLGALGAVLERSPGWTKHLIQVSPDSKTVEVSFHEKEMIDGKLLKTHYTYVLDNTILKKEGEEVFTNEHQNDEIALLEKAYAIHRMIQGHAEQDDEKNYKGDINFSLDINGEPTKFTRPKIGFAQALHYGDSTKVLYSLVGTNTELGLIKAPEKKIIRGSKYSKEQNKLYKTLHEACRKEKMAIIATTKKMSEFKYVEMIDSEPKASEMKNNTIYLRATSSGKYKPYWIINDTLKSKPPQELSDLTKAVLPTIGDANQKIRSDNKQLVKTISAIFGCSTGFKAKGLVAGHVYSLVDCYERDGLKFALITNPWSQEVREYEYKNNGNKLTAKRADQLSKDNINETNPRSKPITPGSSALASNDAEANRYLYSNQGYMEVELSDISKRFAYFAITDNPDLSVKKILTNLAKDSRSLKGPSGIKAILKELKSGGPLPLRDAIIKITEERIAKPSQTRDPVINEFYILLNEKLKTQPDLPIQHAIKEAHAASQLKKINAVEISKTKSIAKAAKSLVSTHFIISKFSKLTHSNDSKFNEKHDQHDQKENTLSGERNRATTDSSHTLHSSESPPVKPTAVNIEKVDDMIKHIIDCRNDMKSIKTLDNQISHYENQILEHHTQIIATGAASTKPIIDREAVSREINTLGKDGNTILHVLAKKLANTDMQSQEGFYLKEMMGDLIREFGADVLIKNKENKTPIDYFADKNILKDLVIPKLKEAEIESISRLKQANSLPEQSRDQVVKAEKQYLDGVIKRIDGLTHVGSNKDIKKANNTQHKMSTASSETMRYSVNKNR
jgi:hypothetical protein